MASRAVVVLIIELIVCINILFFHCYIIVSIDFSIIIIAIRKSSLPCKQFRGSFSAGLRFFNAKFSHYTHTNMKPNQLTHVRFEISSTNNVKTKSKHFIFGLFPRSAVYCILYRRYTCIGYNLQFNFELALRALMLLSQIFFKLLIFILVTTVCV